jgi:phosphoribosyl 1,2-cyclic phosphodiesterase
MLNVTFHGVRGSTPCHGPETAKYGGNTSCVAVQAEGQRPLLLDMGTGLRYFGKNFLATSSTPLDAVALVTHLHWDHIQGLPFFAPILQDGARLEVFGPVQEDGSTFASAVQNAIKQPTFPVGLHDLRGKFQFHDVADSVISIDGYQIISRLVPHIGPTVGYRIEFGGASIAYISDHQQPYDGSFAVPDGVRELVEGVDLLIHDAQYTMEEFADKAHWGHCTAEFAVGIGLACRAKRVALYHHDPDRTDDQLDATRACSASAGMEVFVAREGVTITL